jgi:hypothetical protein
VALLVAQIEEELALMETLGNGFTVTFVLAEFEQPFTVY